MASEGVAARLFGFFGGGVFAGCGGRWTPDDVLQRAVMLQKIEIGGGDRAQRRAEIARDGDGLQKNLRQDHRGAPVEIDAAGMHLADKRAE